MMKIFVSLLLCLALVFPAFSQAVDLGQVDLASLDLRQADLSRASMYFAGAVDLLVTDVYYMGVPYAALLKHDGYGRVEIAVPPTASPEGMPVALDLSNIKFALTTDGIQVSNILADGFLVSGKLVPTRDLDLLVSPPIVLAMPPAAPASTPVVADDSAALRNQVSSLQRELTAAQAAKTDADRKAAEADRKANEANTRISALEIQLRLASSATPGAAPAPQTAADIVRAVSRPVKSGWAGGLPARGSWSTVGEALRQTSAGEKFAKYTMPVQQDADELVYTFQGTGNTASWSGYGLHFLGSGSRQSDMYGYGSSYLVWVTRDPGNTQSDKTFVQLYRSYDDVRMVQLASKAIVESIGATLDITVYVNRRTGIVGVGVGTTPVIEFYDPSVIRSGTHVAGRALGQATITNLKVMSR
jgi:hypothetical protein